MCLLVEALIFVAWQPVTLELGVPTVKSECVIRFRVDVERHLGIDLWPFGTWVPSYGDLEALQFCLRHGDADRIRITLLDSIEDRAFTLSNPVHGYLVPPSVPENFASVMPGSLVP